MYEKIIERVFGAGNGNGNDPATTQALAPEVLAIGDTLDLSGWELTVDDVEFLGQLQLGLMTFQTDRDDQVFVYVSVTIANNTDTQGTLFPSTLRSPGALTTVLRYNDRSILRTAVRGYGRDATDRRTGAGSTADARLVFMVDAEMEHSEEPIELVIRTNAGDVIGVFALR